ncbi:MAG TPA: beta-galactosidase trimerization domain-containing protein, partial [Polyangiaceae bacterium]|nr:beta-galactosidase trimerization domain-containing protein [Polyangiaceae bacterium]
PSHQNWAPYCRLKPPGQLRLQSFQAIAHGAESVMYFQWRKSRGGIEKLHGAVVEHHGRTDARVFREVSALGHELASLGGLTLGGRTPARVAVLFDWECWWALGASSGPSRDLDYYLEVTSAFAALHAAGIQSDVVGPEADLARYDVIVAPVAYLMRADQAARIADRTRAGATFVTTFFSGVVDETDRVHEGGPPGPLRDLLGITVEELDALPESASQAVRFDRPFGELAAGTECPASLLCERVWLHGAKPVARYMLQFYSQQAAVTLNAYGEGKAYYVATRLDRRAWSALLRAICAERGIASPLPEGAAPPEGVEVTVRVSPGGTALLYLLNHGSAARDVPIGPRTHVDLLTGKSLTDVARLEPGDVLVLR